MAHNKYFENAYLDFRKKNLKPLKSIKELEKLVTKAEKEKAEAWQEYFKAWIAIGERRYPDAHYALKKALKLKPNLCFAKVSEIYVMIHLGLIEEALPICESLTEDLRKSKNSTDRNALAEAVLNFGALHYYLGNPKKCIAYLEEVLDWHRTKKVPVLGSTALVLTYSLALLIWTREPEDALELIDESLYIDPDSASALELRARILRLLARKDPSRTGEAEEATKKAAEVSGFEDKPEVRIYLDVILEEFEESKKSEYYAKIRKNQKRLGEFLADEPSFNPRRSCLLVLREWNSYTPAIPDEYDPGRGGGYFIWHNAQGIVIDPGYDFIRNFGEAGGRLRDIHHILLTHAHNDHTADFESLLVLLNKYNKLHKESKKVNLYLSQGALRKFSGLIPLRGSSYLDEVVVLNRGRNEDAQAMKLFEGATVIVLPAYHDDVITQRDAIGLGFIFDGDGWKRKLVFTGDTGLFPKCYDEQGEPLTFSKYPDVYKVNQKEDKAIYNQYPRDLFEPDLLVAHIGSIKKYELNPETPIFDEETPRFYPDHLGILGIVKIVDKLNPKKVVVSEMGEELKEIRKDLVDHVQQALEKKRHVVHNGSVPFCCPGDRTIVYYLDEGHLLCHTSCRPEPVEGLTHTEFKHDSNEPSRVYIYKKSEEKDPGTVQRAIQTYYDKLKNRRLQHHFK